MTAEKYQRTVGYPSTSWASCLEAVTDGVGRRGALPKQTMTRHTMNNGRLDNEQWGGATNFV